MRPEARLGAARASRRRVLAIACAFFAFAGLGWVLFGVAPLRASLRARVADALAARFPGATLSGEVRADGLFRLSAGPMALAAGAPGSPPLVTVERVSVRPRLRALLAGRLEVASIALDGVRVEAGARGERLADVARALEARRAPASGAPTSPLPLPTLSFTRAFVRMSSPVAAAPPAALGPLAGSATFGREGTASTARVLLRLPGGGDGLVHVRWRSGQAAVVVKLHGLGAAALPEGWRAHLPVEDAGGTFDVEIDAPHLVTVSEGEARVQAVTRDLELRDHRLSPETVGPLRVRVDGTARWDLRAGSGALERARLDLGESGRAGAALRIAFASRPEPRVDLEVVAASLDWEALVGALPPALAPPPEAPAIRGALAASLRLSGPVRRPEALRVEGQLDPSGLEPARARGAALDLARPFTWQGPLPDGSTRQVVIGPRNPAFVPIGSLPAHVVRAVLASEDAGFYGHHGFDVAEIQDALTRSGERRLRGASTITQQIAKNLFLSGERTYTRKFREALATVALEASLDKRRLLEIYLNMAEWGPGVFGIGQAARHWFGKDARELTPKEAAFLATVIPNPVRYEMYRRRGALTDHWEERVRDLLVKLRAADVIDDEQLRQAWDAPLAFAHGA
jgi:monofunctional biosynthetic peptidoglycan transglycosylase